MRQLLIVIALTMALAGWGFLSVMDVSSNAQVNFIASSSMYKLSQLANSTSDIWPITQESAYVTNGWIDIPAQQAFHIGYYGSMIMFWLLGILVILVVSRNDK